ncbi:MULTISPECIES: 3-deoxy-manno-octulosonate cytidylyltransferase [unclassified Marinimicrobium]|jgi:3-deoxy-manno-octulosonate cytidylyltransferase (CMP-KDO synthetase)|uniref:3-deoxy-manno-octulosonate cytidylyltransferase n=3 Tax=Marinimicrobium TaxID=359337 RepID=UPI000C4890DB|nr:MULTISPECIES: 3-deoxy-manno-octulosonate cytidylyltransferase [unclassified Marinimicrobium]MAN53041.1 3-deoxy-manno-octulosonate cytidylyltransferase [Marinimicrobium sp.]
MSFYVVIPARYASSRLPAKPLKDIAGKPMIQHVYERARESAATQVIIATDDERIEQAARAFGATVCMTSADHQSGTDRLQEVVSQLGLPDDAIVVNVQGDEPLIPPAVINQVAQNLAGDSSASVATLCEPIELVEDFCNPNIVKVVMDAHGRALYFSRAPIPYPRDAFAGEGRALPEDFVARRHIGIYAYRVGLLHRFVTWDQAPLERFESLEQLRVMWQGESIHVAEACRPVPGGVDTELDLDRVRRLLGS